MRITLSILTLSSIIFFLLTGCQKTSDDLILNPGDSLAIFQLIKTEPNCAVVNTEGDFVTGASLDSKENITLEVDVLRAGKWEHSTDTLNGFYFSGSGVFSVTGRQKITLNASGTPVSPGNYKFSVDTSSSTVLIAVLKHNIEGEPVGQDSYFKGTIDGVDYLVNAAVQGPDDIPYAVSGIDTLSFISFLSISPNDIAPGPASFGIQREFLYNGTTVTEEKFKNFFTPGAYAFQDHKNTCIPYGSRTGITISFSLVEDSFVTFDGSANQEGSSFAIVGIEDGHNEKGIYYVKVKSRFNCKLYNYKDGSFKNLTNGELVSYFFKP